MKRNPGLGVVLAVIGIISGSIQHAAGKGRYQSMDARPEPLLSHSGRIRLRAASLVKRVPSPALLVAFVALLAWALLSGTPPALAQDVTYDSNTNRTTQSTGSAVTSDRLAHGLETDGEIGGAINSIVTGTGADAGNTSVWTEAGGEPDTRQAITDTDGMTVGQRVSLVVVDICDRTPEVETAVLQIVWISDPDATCSTVTSEQLAAIDGKLYIIGYSNPTLLKSDFEGLTGITSIEISRSPMLRTVPADAFDEFNKSGVFDLFLRFSGIKTLEAGAFDGFSNLEILLLQSNQIRDLEEGIFDGLTAMAELNVQENLLTDLPEGIFDDLSNLQILSLHNNRLSTLPDGVFEENSSLTNISLGQNNLTELDADLFDPLDDSLTDLYFGNNDLTTLPEDIFDGLDGIARLDFTGNDLTALPVDLFDPLDDSLQYLYLYDNDLATLPEDIFDGLGGITRLYLYGNDLTALPADLFDPLDDSLQYLYLHDNDLAALPEDIFDGLDGIKRLYLHGNALSALGADLFDPLDGSLQHLYLHDNDLTALPVNIFDGLDGITLLYLHGNDLSALGAEVFDPLDGSLEELFLNDNDLTTLAYDIFDGLDYLYILDLSDNDLTALDFLLFDPVADGLGKLYLRSNSLTALPSGIFYGLYLGDLDLSCNDLTALDLTLLDPIVNSLDYLDISGNDFTTPPTETAIRAKVPYLTYLFLGDNSSCYSATETGLSSLTVSEGTLDPPFAAGVRRFSVEVDSDVTTVDVIPTPKDPNGEVEPFASTPDGDPNRSGIQVSVVSGVTKVSWYVYSKDGSSQTYNVDVLKYPESSNASLRDLTLSGLTLEPQFRRDTFTYTATANNEMAQTTVIPRKSDVDAEMAINGLTGSERTVALGVGSNTITVRVTSEDNATTQTYSIVVTREAERNLVVNPTTLSIDEGHSADFEVSLSSQPTSNVTVTVTSGDIGAATVSPPTLNFTTTNWNSTKTVTVTGVNDHPDTNNETLAVSLSASGGGYTGRTASVSVSVTDDGNDDVRVSFGSSSYTAKEAGTDATVSVELSHASSSSSTIQLTSTRLGGATPGDHSIVPPSLTFAAGETHKTFTVVATDDNEDDDGESVQLGFGTLPSGFARGAHATTTVALVDNDTQMPVVTIEPAATREGQDIVFTVRIVRPTDGFQSLYYGTGSSSLPPRSRAATDGEDYVTPHPASKVIQIGYGQRTAEIRFSTIDDDLVEGTEMFRIGLYPSNSITLGTPHSAIGIISDNDNGGAPYYDSIRDDILTTGGLGLGGPVIGRIETAQDRDWYRTNLLENHCYRILAEGLTLDNPNIPGVYRSDGSHISGTGSGGGRGETAQAHVKLDTTGKYYIAVTHYYFGQKGTDNTYRLSLSDLGTSDTSCGAAKASAIAGPLEISVADASKREWPNPQAYLIFDVTLDRDADEEVRVDYSTVDGTAVAGQDYEAQSGTLVFRIGEDSKRIWVPIQFDREDEETETMTLRLSNASGARIRRDAATGSIEDYSSRR